MPRSERARRPGKADARAETRREALISATHVTDGSRTWAWALAGTTLARCSATSVYHCFTSHPSWITLSDLGPYGLKTKFV